MLVSCCSGEDVSASVSCGVGASHDQYIDGSAGLQCGRVGSCADSRENITAHGHLGFTSAIVAVA